FTPAASTSTTACSGPATGSSNSPARGTPYSCRTAALIAAHHASGRRAVAISLLEVWPEVLGGDLARGRPAGPVRYLRAGLLPRGQPGDHVQGLLAGEEHSPDDGLEGPRRDRRSGARRDRLGRGVRLLGGDPALLDDEVGGVSRGIDRTHARDPAM